MLTERQKAKIRKQNEERDKKFVSGLNEEEKKKRTEYIAARNKADKAYADFFEGTITGEEFAAAETEKEKCRRAYFGLVIRNRNKNKPSTPKQSADTKKTAAKPKRPTAGKKK